MKSTAIRERYILVAYAIAAELVGVFGMLVYDRKKTSYEPAYRRASLEMDRIEKVLFTAAERKRHRGSGES